MMFPAMGQPSMPAIMPGPGMMSGPPNPMGGQMGMNPNPMGGQMNMNQNPFGNQF